MRDVIPQSNRFGLKKPGPGRAVFTAIWRGAGKVARRLIDKEQSVREIADTFNVHTAAIYRLSKTAA